MSDVKYSVRLSYKAEQDVASVLEWFRDQSATVAGSRWMARLMEKIDTLEMSPNRCPLAAEAEDLGVEIRQLLFGKRRGTYRILFQIDGRTVNILRIRHSARDELKGRDL